MKPEPEEKFKQMAEAHNKLVGKIIGLEPITALEIAEADPTSVCFMGYKAFNKMLEDEHVEDFPEHLKKLAREDYRLDNESRDLDYKLSKLGKRATPEEKEKIKLRKRQIRERREEIRRLLYDENGNFRKKEGE